MGLNHIKIKFKWNLFRRSRNWHKLILWSFRAFTGTRICSSTCEITVSGGWNGLSLTRKEPYKWIIFFEPKSCGPFQWNMQTEHTYAGLWLYCFAVNSLVSWQLFVLLLGNVFTNYSCFSHSNIICGLYDIYMRTYVVWMIVKLQGNCCSLTVLTGFWCFSQSLQACTKIVFKMPPGLLLHIFFPFQYWRIIPSFDGV